MQQKKNVRIKMFAAMLVVLLMLAAISGCGSETAQPDPNIGVWKATTIEMFGTEYNAVEMFDGDVIIELMEGGECTFSAMGETDYYSWGFKEGILTISEASVPIITGVVTGDTMKVERFLNTDMNATFVKDNGQSTAGSQNAEANNTEETSGDTGEQGHFSAADMKIIKENLEKDYDEGLLRDRSYEDIRDSYFKGLEGHLYMDTSTISQYYWYVIGSNENQYVKVTFQDYGSGKKTAGGYGAYVP